jgi:hypothetical protein
VTPDNAPTVITAAEFVSGGYAQRVAAGECLVHGYLGREVVSVVLEGLWTRFRNDDTSWLMGDEGRSRLQVRWLLANDELASLRAQVARYRAALEAVASELNELEYVTENNAGQTWSDYEGAVKSSIRGIRAALAETEEANG